MGILIEEGIPATCHVLGYGLLLSEEIIDEIIEDTSRRKF
jgi:hypothetical protein